MLKNHSRPTGDNLPVLSNKVSRNRSTGLHRRLTKQLEAVVQHEGRIVIVDDGSGQPDVNNIVCAAKSFWRAAHGIEFAQSNVFGHGGRMWELIV